MLLAPELPPDVPPVQRLTLAEALRIAGQDNPQLAASAHQVASAQANLFGQKQPVNPLLYVTGTTNTPSGLEPSDPTRYGGEGLFEISYPNADRAGTQGFIHDLLLPMPFK